MSKVTDLFTKHGVESAELMASVEQIVKTAESNNTGIPQSRLSEVIGERNELRADVAELNATIAENKVKITGLETTVTESETYKTELTEFKHKAFKEKRDIWVEKSKVFNVEEDDKLYDKIQAIKADFIFHDKIDDYTEQEIAQDISMLKPYEKIGYFGKPTTTEDDLDDSRGKGEENNKERGKSAFETFLA